MTSREIVRETFLRFFESQGHTPVDSSALVPAEDPTLLFTNAGMVQFKKVFLGEDQRPYTRATTSQKCVRAGGKHNDLENVGYTARHHTFFEMLGNFSFGDYFKEGCHRDAWEFLTRHYRLPADKLWVTVFHEDDDEAFELWEKIDGLPPRRIVRPGRKGQFLGHGRHRPLRSLLRDPHRPGRGRLRRRTAARLRLRPVSGAVELVFMQFNRDAAGVHDPLPKPSIDTGMGLERISAVVQGVKSNYDSDLLRPLIAGIESLAGQAYGARNRRTCPSGSSPTIPGPPPFWSPTGCCRPTRAAATSSAASCAGPSASAGS